MPGRPCRLPSCLTSFRVFAITGHFGRLIEMKQLEPIRQFENNTTSGGGGGAEPSAADDSQTQGPANPAERQEPRSPAQRQTPDFKVIERSGAEPQPAVQPDPSSAGGPAPDSLGAKIGLMLFGIFISLILFEAAFRLFASESALQLSSADAPTWRDRPANFYMPESTVDNRDFFYPAAKEPGTFRVIVVGDSFTFGGKLQFDDTFPKRLERMLNLNRNHRRVEVLNWGVPGFSTRNEEVLVRRAGRDFHADLVILEITLNDPELKPYKVTHSFQDNQGDVVVSHWIFNYWKSLGYLVRRIYNTITHDDYKKYYFDLYEKQDTWNNFKIGIRRIHQIASTEKVPVLGVIFPLFSHPLDERYPFAPLHEKIEQYLSSQSFPYLDLFSNYQGIPPERLQAMPGKDSHPNEIAHRIAADAIYHELLLRDLVPEDVKIKKLYPGARKLRNRIPNASIPTPEDTQPIEEQGQPAADGDDDLPGSDHPANESQK